MFPRPIEIGGVIGVTRFHPLALPGRIPAAWHHRHHELILVRRGSFHIAGRGRVLDASPGDVFFYPAGVKHAEWADIGTPPAEALWIGFSTPLNAKPTEIIVLRDTRGRIAELANWMLDDVAAGRPTSDPQTYALLNVILGEVELLLTGVGVLPPWVRRIHDHVHDHLTDELSVAELARIAELSAYHFIRAYRKATGQTPMAMVRSVRIQRARQLLFETRLPIKQIAVQAGLGDAQAMDRIFRHYVGVPPDRLRKAHWKEAAQYGSPHPVPAITRRGGRRVPG